MTSHDSDRVNDLFAGISCDFTPASVSHVAHVLYAPVSHDREVTGYCASVLSDTELQRADRLAGEHEMALFQQRRAFSRFCAATALESPQPLSEIRLEHTENGRPYLADAPDLWLSFSSCRFGMLGAWSSTRGIGVDVEDHTRKLEAGELARQYFSIAEAEAVEGAGSVERLRTFYRFWGLKEAALKSIGEGLPFGLDAFEFELDPNPRVTHAPADHGGPKEFDAHVIEWADICAALVIRSLT